MPAVVLHVPPAVLAGNGGGERFYHPFQRGLRAAGIRARMVLHNRATALDEVAADEAFHVFDHGAVQHPRALNTASAYLLPYRYMDPVGIRGFSRTGRRSLRPMPRILRQRPPSLPGSGRALSPGACRAMTSPKQRWRCPRIASRSFCRPKATARSARPAI